MKVLIYTGTGRLRPTAHIETSRDSLRRSFKQGGQSAAVEIHAGLEEGTQDKDNHDFHDPAQAPQGCRDLFRPHAVALGVAYHAVALAFLRVPAPTREISQGSEFRSGFRRHFVDNIITDREISNDSSEPDHFA